MVTALELKNTRVLVVGGGGIGAATATAFAAAGARVFAAGRPGRGLSQVAAEIGGEMVALDMLDNPAIEAFFAKAAPFDHLAITAAATKSGPSAYRIARATKMNNGGPITFVSGFLSNWPSG